MTYRLYFSPDSANIVIRMALEELWLTYDDREVPRKRSERDADFHRLNPRGLLPVLIDQNDEMVLFETAAILLFLADKYQALGGGIQESKDRGDFLKWLFMLSNTLHADLAMRFYAERYVTHDEQIEPLLQATKTRILGHCQTLEDAMQSHDGSYFLKTGLSVCDFYLACCLRWAQLYPAFDPALTGAQLSEFPKLYKLLETLGNRDAVKRSLTKEGIIGDAFLNPHSPLGERVRDSIGSVNP